MSLLAKLKHEFKRMLLVTAYFAVCFGAVLLLKELLLAEYQIKFHHFSLALISALIVAKVVLLMEHVPLGSYVSRSPGWVDLVTRTILYVLGVFVALVLEKGFETRHEYGGFIKAFPGVFSHAEFHHVWVSVIVAGGSLLSFNMLTLVEQSVGEGTIARALSSPVPDREAPTP